MHGLCNLWRPWKRASSRTCVKWVAAVGRGGEQQPGARPTASFEVGNADTDRSSAVLVGLNPLRLPYVQDGTVCALEASRTTRRHLAAPICSGPSGPGCRGRFGLSSPCRTGATLAVPAVD